MASKTDSLAPSRKRPNRDARAIGNPHVFTSPLQNSHFKQAPDVIVRLCQIAKLAGVTAHVFRHSIASAAGDLGFSDIAIARLLGHDARGITQGYIHIDEGLCIATEKVSQRIADLLDGKAATFREPSAPAE